MANNSITLFGADYDEYLKYQASKQQSSSSIAYVAQPGNSFACLTQLSHNGSWMFDSGTSDHIFDNKNLFSTLQSPSVSSIITLANGSQTVIKGLGESKFLSSLPLVSVLYAPEYPFNLISISKLSNYLNCIVIFDPHFVIVQDRNTEKMIGKGYESNGLYYLASPVAPTAFTLQSKCTQTHT